MSQVIGAAHITRTIHVDCQVETAFEIWTKKLSSWWPAGHTMSGRSDIEITMEDRADGRFFERTSEGTEYDWGKVTIWDPPHHLVYDWYLGGDPEQPTRVQIHFVASEAGGTQVNIEHHASAMPGTLWVQRNQAFGNSWDQVIAAYRAASSSA